MNRSDYFELIQRDLDGELNAQEQEQLQQILDKDIDARRYYDALTISTKMIGKLPQQDPPRELTGKIMEKIEPARYAPPKYDLLDALITFLQPRRGMVAAFAALILVAIAIVSVIGVFQPDRSAGLTGTIGLRPAEVDPFTISGNNFNGNFRLQPEENGYSLEGSVQCSGDCTLRVRFFPPGSVQPVDTGTGETPAGQDHILLRNGGGQPIRLRFRIVGQTPEYLTVTVESEGDPALIKKIILE